MTGWGEADFRAALRTNPQLMTVVDRASVLGLNDWYVTGGAVFQTVWNHVTGRPPTTGIGDYDLFYFDPADQSYEAEDHVIAAAATLYGDLGVRVDVKNQARVHLWYETRFGIPAREFTSSQDAIDQFVSTTCCFGIRRSGEGYDVYAPHGYDDVFTMVLRANRASDAREVFAAKCAKWQAIWPELVVESWDPMR